MAGKLKYRAKLTKFQIRNLWMDVQNAKADNRSHEEWLSAANRELVGLAEVKVGIMKMQFPELKDPEGIVECLLSFEATSGAKLALIQSARGASFRKRETIRETADGFGVEFSKLVRKQISLEDSKDLDEDAELAGVPGVEEPDQAPASVKDPQKE